MPSRDFVNLDFVSSNMRLSNWHAINGTHSCFVPGLSLSKATAPLSESMLAAALLFRQSVWRQLDARYYDITWTAPWVEWSRCFSHWTSQIIPWFALLFSYLCLAWKEQHAFSPALLLGRILTESWSDVLNDSIGLLCPGQLRDTSLFTLGFPSLHSSLGTINSS